MKRLLRFQDFMSRTLRFQVKYILQHGQTVYGRYTSLKTLIKNNAKGTNEVTRTLIIVQDLQ